MAGEDLVEAFLPEPYPRRGDRGCLGPLVRSIREVGCLCPIIARPREGKLQVVCGYRRLLASQIAGIPAVPILVRQLSDQECRRLYTEENDQRISPAPEWQLRMPASELQASRPEGRTFELRTASAAGGEAERTSRQGLQQESTLSSGEKARTGGSRNLGMLMLFRRTETCFRRIASTHMIPVEEVETIASDLIEMSPIRRGLDLRAFYATGSTDWLAAHSLLVSGLGIHLVESLEWTPGQVMKFALACILHDIGMLFVPRESLIHPRQLKRSERELIEKHTEIGREIIQGSRAWGAQVHLVAQDHHERWNGAGYPLGKKGKEVDLPSRLVAFLDCFGALIATRPYRKPLLYSQALHAMSALTELGHHDPSILIHFRNVFTELPVGSCLQLKDGRVGRVVGKDPRNARRHRIRILGSPAGEKSESPIWIESEENVLSEIHPYFQKDKDLPPTEPVWAPLKRERWILESIGTKVSSET